MTRLSKADEQYYIEAKYRFIIKIGILIVLVVLALIDAIFTKFEIPTEVDLALIAAVAGLETREQFKRKRHIEDMTRRIAKRSTIKKDKVNKE